MANHDGQQGVGSGWSAEDMTDNARAGRRSMGLAKRMHAGYVREMELVQDGRKAHGLDANDPSIR